MTKAASATMTATATARLSNSEVDSLLSLGDSEFDDWLNSVNPRIRPIVIETLRDCARRRRPASPAALGRIAWGSRWAACRHLELLDRSLFELAQRTARRLIVMMPPRHGKSVLVSQFLPAWYLGMNPDHRVILVSYEAGFAAAWGRRARDVMIEHGVSCFGLCVRADSSAAHRWDLEHFFGGMTTAGVGGPITGRGADLLIVDDPIKNAEQALSEAYREKMWDWWTSTAFTRLEPEGIAVIVQTRWHDDDLTGRVLREQAEEQWRVVSLPAIAAEHDPLGRRPGEALWPERFPLSRLEQMRAAMPSYWWESLYQQRPGRHQKLLWPAEYFEGHDLWFDRWPNELPLRVMALDPSKGKGARWADYSAYVLLGVQDGGLLWVEADLSNDRPPQKLVEDGIELALRFRPHAFKIESNAWQDLLQPMFAAALRKRGLLQAEPTGIHNRIKKELRIENLDGLLRARQFRFRRTQGTELLVEQLRNFPLGRHDDGPDALEMAVRTAQELWEGEEREEIISYQPSVISY